MVNWKSKYLEMKLKYINSKQKAGSSTSTLRTSLHSYSQESDETQNEICKSILKYFNYGERWFQNQFDEIDRLISENIDNERYINELYKHKLQLSYLNRKLRLDKEYWVLRFENINKDWKKYGENSEEMRKLFNRYMFDTE